MRFLHRVVEMQCETTGMAKPLLFQIASPHGDLTLGRFATQDLSSFSNLNAFANAEHKPRDSRSSGILPQLECHQDHAYSYDPRSLQQFLTGPVLIATRC
jgi:hypothetical protein